MVRCPNCGHENPDHTHLCQRCRKPMKKTTPLALQKTLRLSDVRRDPQYYPPPQSAEAFFGETTRLRLHSPEDNVNIDLDPRQPDSITLGRLDPVGGIYPDVDLSSLDGTGRGVSRQHARLAILTNALYILDLSSTNGTYLNDRHLQPYKPYPLANGDELWLGELRLLVSFLTPFI